MDEMVLSTQKWLNKKYSNVTGFDKVPENGRTGWPTIYGLIEGLQVELGITNLVANFGPTTEKMYDTQVTPKWGKNLPKNIVFLIQGAFWCKGINPGGFDGVYTPYLDTAVKELQTDAGFNGSAVTGVLDAKWAKALFDMSAFVLVPGGDSKIRKMQQWLNVNYLEYTGIMPCDGIYQRNSNQALIFALQAEEGLSPEEANGAYGPTTTRLTPTLQEGDNNDFVPILKYGLLVNGFYDSNDFSTVFTSDVGEAVLSFRGFMSLSPYNRIADVTVIKGLLSSAGNTNRPADGVDTSTQLTPAQIQTLRDNDVLIVGRYLTGTVGTGSNKRNKFLTIEESNRIFEAGMKIFPIYQDGGYYIEYFNQLQGYQDGGKAGKAATQLGIPKGTVIYFAVDLDILGDDISSTAIEYFKGINQVIQNYGYLVGIYGTRNVCNQVISAKLAQTTFVADMSTGFSGNLGFPMPKEWAFDQFIEYTLGSGAGAVGIDNVAVSGRDPGFDHLDNTIGGSQNFIEFIQKVQKLAKEYSTSDPLSVDKLVADYLKNPDYNNIFWKVICGQPDNNFIEYVNERIPENLRFYDYVDPTTGQTIGGTHFFAAISGYYEQGLAGYDHANLGDGCGWLGDLDTLLIDYHLHGKSYDSPYAFGLDWIGGKGKSAGYFSEIDLIADIDAWNVCNQRNSVDNLTLSDVIKQYLEQSTNNRYSYFYETRTASSRANLLSIAGNALLGGGDLGAFRVGILGYFNRETLEEEINVGVKEELCKAFADKIIELSRKENN